MFLRLVVILFFNLDYMVGVAQLVELQVVALVAAGSSPVAHPNFRS